MTIALVAAHSIWASREAFVEWTRSQPIRNAHKNAGGHSILYLEAPRFEESEVMQTIG